MTNYRPMLGNNDAFDLLEVDYPIAGSIKRDGIRGETLSHNLISRELKLIPNKQVQSFAETIKQFDYILNTEMYIHGLPFNEHATFIMSEDLASRKHSDNIKTKLRKKELTNNYYYYLKLPTNFQFYIFDVVNDMGYCDRIDWLKRTLPTDYTYSIVDYKILNNAEEVLEMFDTAMTDGYEGLVLRKPDGKYKFGRATKREGTFLKLKPIETLEATCVGFTERMINTNVSFVNELGLLTKRNTVDDKQGTGIAAAVVTNYNGNELKITLTGTEEYRRYLFEHQDECIGRKVQFKGMVYGSKNLPRHPVFIKFI